MFHFDFKFEDDVDKVTFNEDATDDGNDLDSNSRQAGESFSEIDLDSLLKSLPTQISYSFISVPSPNDHTPDLKLARRDLFDARFQLISDGTDDPESAGPASGCNPSIASALQFIDNPSDLVPLVYEGGLKTWECSLDLASCLRRDGHAASTKGQRVLELGCGTAIPTLCVLQAILWSSPTSDPETHIHLQDYNVSVLQLVTMPNIILTWYTSPAADAYRASEVNALGDADSESELYITLELLHAFKTSLDNHGVRLRFFSGSWDTFNLRHTGGPYHLVLTSETIYDPDSLPSLVRVMRDACAGSYEYVCLVAGKTVYFGVGGGVVEFVRCVESDSVANERGGGGKVDTVWEKSTGVSRKVMRIRWR